MKYVLYMKVIHYEKIYEGWFLLNELSDSKLFEDELIQNQKLIRELANTIVRGTREKCSFPVFNIDALVENTLCSLQTKYFTFCPPPPQIENMEIVQYDNLNKLKLFNKIFENSELDDFIKVFNQKNSQTVQPPTPADSLLVYTDTTPAASADPVPADKVKRKKRTPLPPNLKVKIIDFARRNPGMTFKELAQHFNVSKEVFRKGKPLWESIQEVRTGNLNRHAEKLDKRFEDED